MAFRLKASGNYNKTKKFLEKAKKFQVDEVMKKYGEIGVAALRNATPVRTGLTAASWSYEIERKDGKIALIFLNNNVNKGVNIAIILQYGHGTGWGGYVQGRDYINPALQPVFDLLAESAWKEVTS